MRTTRLSSGVLWVWIAACTAPGEKADDAPDDTDGLVDTDDEDDDDDDTDDEEAATATVVQGRIVLPWGMTDALSTLTVHGAGADAQVRADGAFTLDVGDGGPVVVVVQDAEARIRLFGFVDAEAEADANVIDAHATSTVLLWYAMRFHSAPTASWPDLIDLIDASPATANLAITVGAGTATEPGIMDDPEIPLQDDIQNGVRLILMEWMPAAATSLPLQGQLPAPVNNALVLSEPSAAQSGVIVGPNLGGNGLQITNTLRRHGWYFVYKTAYEDQDGVRHEVDPPTLVQDGYLEAPTGITGTVSTLAEWATGTLGFQPVSVTVPIEVAESEQVVFLDAVVAGAHFPGFSERPFWIDASDPTEARWESRAVEMTALSFVKDLMFPAIYAVAKPLKSHRKNSGVSFLDASVVLSALKAQAPDFATKFADGDWDGALVTALKAMANSQELRTTVIGIMEGLLEDSALGGKIDTMALVEANTLVASIDIGLGVADIGLLLSDVSQAEMADRWDVRAIPAPVFLSADEEELHPEDPETRVKVELPGGVPGAVHCYRWTITGAGELSAFAGGSTTAGGPPLYTTEHDLLYVADEGDVVDGPLATITVEAFELLPGATCGEPGLGAPIGQDTLSLVGNEEPLVPCKDAFDFAYWQAEAGSITVTVAGGYGDLVEVSVDFPDHPANELRSVNVFVNRGVGDRAGITADGAFGFNSETWTSYHDIQRDTALGMVRISGASVFADVESSLRVTVPTTELPTDCDSGVGSESCCPTWVHDPIYGLVLKGPMVVVEVLGELQEGRLGRTVVPIRSN